MIRIKRTYDPPARGDGRRILVERLWPRGMTKAAVAADAWMKDVAPSTELRKWFDHQVERWEEFRRRYRDELNANPGGWEPIIDASKRGTVTLLYSAHDSVHNGAVVLRDYLVERERRTARMQGDAPRTGRAARPEKPASTGRPPRGSKVRGSEPARARRAGGRREVALQVRKATEPRPPKH